MKSEFKSGDIVIFNDKLFLVKQGLASTTQPKKWEKVQFEYLAYHLRDVGLNKKVEVDTEKVYVLKESEIRKAVLPPLVSEEIDKSIYLRGNDQEEPQEDAEVLDKGRCVRVKGESGIYRILRVESSSCWLDKLIIKGNNISVDIIPVRKDYKKLERLSAYEESLLRRESKPRVMGTLAQELRLEEMTNRFVESMTTHKEAQEDVIKVKISDEVLSSHLGTCISEVEIEAIESFRREYLAANATLLEKAFIKIRGFIRGLFESIRGISRQEQKNEAATLSNDYSNVEILQTIYVYVDGFLVCPTETRNKLVEFVGEYKRIGSESERNHIVNKLSGTIKTIHHELERGTDDIEKVNAIIDDMIEYVRIVNESSKHSTDAKLELEHDYVKKLIRDSKAVDKVTSVDEIIKSDGYEVSAIECDKE